MLVLSRHRLEVTRVYPSRTFATEVAVLLGADPTLEGITFGQAEAVLTALVRSGILSTRITVADIRGDKVRLGFDAHRTLCVDRQEIVDSKERNGEFAYRA